MKIMKTKLRIMLSFIKISFGEKVFSPIKKIQETIIEVRATIVREVLILLLLSFELGRYLINPLFKPRREKEAISPIADIIVVASPIFAALNNLEQIIQNTNPNTAIIPVLNIK